MENATRGTMRIITEDALYFFGKILFLYITLPLFIGWIAIGYFFDLPFDTVHSISGPAYFFIPTFAIEGYRSLYLPVIGLGGTRKLLLKSFYKIGLLSVSIMVVILNIVQYLLLTIQSQFNDHVVILHPGTFLEPNYHFLGYLAIDLVFAFFLFGVSFLLYAIYFRLGFRKSMIAVIAIVLAGMVINYSGWLSIDFTRLLNAGGITLLFLTFCISLLSLVLTYPLLKDAPLKPKTKRD